MTGFIPPSRDLEGQSGEEHRTKKGDALPTLSVWFFVLYTQILCQCFSEFNISLLGLASKNTFLLACLYQRDVRCACAMTPVILKCKFRRRL